MPQKSGTNVLGTGERLRRAALARFARHGYGTVTMREIAADIGVQAGAIYGHTADKQTLLFELIYAHWETLLAAWDATEKGAKPAERLEALVRFHVRFHLDRPDAQSLCATELRNLSPQNHATIAALRSRYIEALEAILEAGSETGEMRVPDTKLAAHAVISMLDGVAAWQRDDKRLSAERIERIYWNLVRRAVGG
ncbi:MAG: TetR/AcrR family transcriptional regulator [Pseudomonadota bacterium]